MRNLHSNLENQVIKVKMSLHATRGFPLKIRQSSESKVTSRRREVTFDLLFISRHPKRPFLLLGMTFTLEKSRHLIYPKRNECHVVFLSLSFITMKRMCTVVRLLFNTIDYQLNLTARFRVGMCFP